MYTQRQAYGLEKVMKVYLSEYIYPPAREKLAQVAEIVDNFDHIEELDAIILRNIPVTAEMLGRAKNLKVLGSNGLKLAVAAFNIGFINATFQI